jgi:hypothetical protein
MVRLSRLVGCSVRTIQRHVHLLAKLGLIELLQRRRNSKGRFSSYLYRVVHICQSTGHRRHVVDRSPIYKRRTKSAFQNCFAGSWHLNCNSQLVPHDAKLPSQCSQLEGWLTGFEMRSKPLSNPQKAFNARIDPKDEEARQRAIERKRRTAGYEWLFT